MKQLSESESMIAKSSIVRYELEELAEDVGLGIDFFLCAYLFE